MDFTNYIQRKFPPIGVVYSTTRVKNILLKSNLTPSEFLRPFLDFGEEKFNVNFREYHSTISNLSFDLYDVEKFEEVQNYDDIENYVSNLFNDIPEGKNYYTEFEQMYIEYCRFSPTELINTPLIDIIFCSVRDDPLCLIEVVKKNIPTLISKGVYEKSLCCIIIAVNDLSDECEHLDDDKVLLFRNSINAIYQQCFFFYSEINRGLGEKNKDIWEKYIHRIDIYKNRQLIPQETVRGDYISISEREFFKTGLTALFRDKVIPKLCNAIEEITKYIEEKYKGFKNFFKQSKKETSEFNTFYNITSLTSYEKKLYLLTILEFHLHDYHSAYHTLKDLLSSIKSTDCQSYLLPLTQLCCIIRFVKSLKRNKLNINESYVQSVRYSDYRYGLRALLFHVKMNESLLEYNSGIDLIKSILQDVSNYTRLFYPFLLEKLSEYYLRIYPPKRKHFIYYSINAGMKFEAEGGLPRRYALRSYLNSYDFISRCKRGYTYTKMFLCSSLGNLCTQANMIENGIVFYKDLLILKRNRNYSDRRGIQNNFLDLKNLIQKCKSNYDHLLAGFNIPEINLSDTYVIESSDKIFTRKLSKANLFSAFDYSNVLSHSDFRTLKLIDSIILNRQTVSNKYVFQGIPGESYHLKFEIFNPFEIDLVAENISLIYEANGNEIDFTPLSYTLRPRTIKELEIKFTMENEDKYTIKGIQLMLFEQINVKYFFNERKKIPLYENLDEKLKERRMTRTSSKATNYQTQNTKSLPADHNFIFNISNSNNINVSFPKGTNFTLYQHEMYFVPFTIENNSSVSILKYIVYLSDNNNKENNHVLCNNFVRAYKNKTEEFQIPILPQSVGEVNIKILIKCVCESRYQEIEIKRFLISCNIQPSIEIDYSQKILNDTVDALISVSLNSFVTGTISNLILLDEVFTSNKYSVKAVQGWVSIFNEKYDKQYNTVEILKKSNDKDNLKSIEELKRILCLNQTSDDVDSIFLELMSSNNLIFPFTFKVDDNTHYALYLAKMLISSCADNNEYICRTMLNSISLSHEIEDFDEERKYVTGVVRIKDIRDISKMIDEISVEIDMKSCDFEWVGPIKRKLILAKIKEEEVEVKFPFLSPQLKGLIDINKYLLTLKTKEENVLKIRPNEPCIIEI